MDACLQRFEASVGSRPATVTSSVGMDTLTPRRVAHWDSKREMCNNCEHVYLKTLSQYSGFCSVDCKSNMIYLEKVNCTIRAMKDAVSERQHMVEPTVHPEPHLVKVDHQPMNKASFKVEVAGSSVSRSLKHAQSFAQFDRVLDSNHVEWSFSAVL